MLLNRRVFVVKFQSFGSQEWDTGFAIQALLASEMNDEIGDTLKKGHDFIKQSQVCIFLRNKNFVLMVSFQPSLIA